MNARRVRASTVGDVDACVDLFARVVDEGRWLGTEPPLDRLERRERFLAALAGDHAALLVAEEGEQVVGMLTLSVAGYGVADIGMCVDAEWRGRGVGGALVGEAVATARGLGAHKVALQVWPHNQAALRLYRRHGFVEEGRLRRHYRRRNGELWDAVVMGLVLDETSPGSPYDHG
ncbi:MAG: N-acetyltransferase family protein [Acidimicrobiia bacterium]